MISFRIETQCHISNCTLLQLENELRYYFPGRHHDFSDILRWAENANPGDFTSFVEYVDPENIHNTAIITCLED